MLLSSDLEEVAFFSLTGEHQVTNKFIVYEMTDEEGYLLTDTEGTPLISRRSDRSEFLKELREWEMIVESEGIVVKVKLPLSIHRSLQSADGDPFILIDTPGFDDFKNFEFFQTFLQKSSYTPMAILVQDFMKATGSSYSNFKVMEKIKAKAGGNLGVIILYTKIERYLNLQRNEARELGETEGAIETYAEEKYEEHRRVITYELTSLNPILILDYDLKILDSKHKTKYKEKLREFEIQNREQTAKMMEQLKKVIDPAKNFILYMFNVKNTFLYIQQLVEPIITSQFGNTTSFKELNERFNPDRLFVFIYDRVEESVEETLLLVSPREYTDPIKLKNEMLAECESLLR